MSAKTLFELVCSALPKGFNALQLKEYGRPEWHAQNRRIAVAYALRKCPALDWVRYMANNPDVKAAGVDPVLHFLTAGLFEGRKLFAHSFPDDHPADLAAMPKISIIVANHNNAIYLEKSIGSLQGQTLKDIEIIVVDDASTDGSLEILRQMSAADPRIRIFEHKNTQSQHMARKTGVAAATGQYIMFLDSDDYYSIEACQTAYDAISGKYDFVCFNVNPVFHAPLPDAQRREFGNYLNRGAKREFADYEIMPAMFESYILSDLLWNKIYAAGICKRAFALMEDGYLPRGQDIYEALVIASLARSAAKIENALYSYRIGTGISCSSGSEASQAAFATTGNTFACMDRYMQKAGFMEYREKLHDSFLRRSVDAWLQHVTPENCRAYFRAMANQYGIVTVLSHLISRFPSGWEEIANKFQHYGMASDKCTAVNRIGILYTVMGGGGGEVVLMQAASLLASRGYEVTIFLEIPSHLDSSFPSAVRIVYIGATGSGSNRLNTLMQGLANSLIHNPVDVMLCHACYLGEILWSIMLLKYMGIPPVLFLHGAFFRRLLHPDKNYSLQAYGAVMRCGDKVAVLSECEELYYRRIGVNAAYIPNPVRQLGNDWRPDTDFKKRLQNLLVFGRLGDPVKNVQDSLKILRLVNRKMPWVRLTFVGSFVSAEIRKSFYSLARDLGVSGSIRVTGWLDNTDAFIDEAAILLSVAWHESFALTIAEAQARGLPVVMYNLPIQPARGNPAVIQVPLGDTEKAAAEILALLDDEKRWMRLSAIAREKMRQFRPELYADRIISLLSSFCRQSTLSRYKTGDYHIVMGALAEHGAHLPPWLPPQ